MIDTTFRAVMDYFQSVSILQVHELSLLFEMIHTHMRDSCMYYFMHLTDRYKYSDHNSETLISGVFQHFSTVFDKNEKPSNTAFLSVSIIVYRSLLTPLLNEIQTYVKSASVLSRNAGKSDVRSENQGQDRPNNDHDPQNNDTQNMNHESKNDTVVSKIENVIPAEPITLEAGDTIKVQLSNLGYHVDPNSGITNDSKHYKIGIHGIGKLPDDGFTCISG